MSFNKQITSNLFYLTITELFSKVFIFLYTLHLSRVLGAEGFGKIGFASSIMSFLVIFVSIGMDSYGTRQIAQNPNDQSKIVNQIFSLRLALSFLIYLLFLVVINFTNLNQEAKWVTIVYCISLFGQALNLNWVFLAIQKMRPIAIRQVLLNLITMIGIFSLINNKQDTILASFLISSSALLSLLAVVLYYHFKLDKLKIVFDKVLFKTIIYSSFPIGLSFLITQIYNNSAMYFLGTLLSDNFYQAGIMNAAQKFLLLGLIPSSLLQQAFFPTLSNLIGDTLKRNEVFLLYLKTCVVTGVVIAGLIFTYADKIILIQFGDQYQNSIPILQILSINIFLVFINMLYTSPLIAWNYEKVFLKSVILSCAINVTLNYLIIPEYKSIGVSFVIIITEIITNLFLAYYFKKLFKFSAMLKLVKLATLSVILILPGFIIYWHFQLITLSILTNIVGITLLLYLTGLFDKKLIFSIIKKKI